VRADVRCRCELAPGRDGAGAQHPAAAVHVQTPPAAGIRPRTLAWGREHDTRPITTTGDLTDSNVAAYVAKYATKAAECTGTLDRRITPADRITSLPVSDHARRLITECIRLAADPALPDLRLAEWAHMLGFRGHFSTKSRAYSTTLGALRAARAAHQRQHAVNTGHLSDLTGDTILVVAHWSYSGRGHPLGKAVPARPPDPAPPTPPPGDDRLWT
jgi:hypothetical protein